MQQLIWLGVESFGLTVVLTPIFRDIFRSYKVVDQPDHGRKVHVHPIPRVGGIAIAVAYLVVFYLMQFHPGGQALERELSVLSNVIPAALLIFGVGLIDDFFGLRPSYKLMGQTLAVGLALWSGVRISSVADYGISEVWAIPLTAGWLLLCTNAFNLVDGLDGLAAGVGLFSTLTIFIAALVQGNEPLAYATLPLAGCLLGFLCFNFNPATVFLGDCGSLLVGFLLGCFGVIWTQKSATLLGITAPIMAMSLPLVDVALCIVRRWLGSKPIFGADRGHIHHRLLDSGLSPRQAVLLLYGLCGLAATFSLLQSLVDDILLAGFICVLFVGVAWVGIRSLGYTEFMLAGRLLRIREFQRSVSGRMALTAFEKSIAKANTVEECWSAVLRYANIFGFCAVRMRLAGSTNVDWPDSADARQYWVVRVPISDFDYLELGREIGSDTLPTLSVSFIDLLALTLAAKSEQFALSPATGAAASESGA